jgi:UDP-2,3-diacylglucosamine pyrophosphatase LpxH
MRLVAVACCALACGGRSATVTAKDDQLAKRFPLAAADDRAVCDHLIKQPGLTVDAEPKIRRKVIVSDLHLGPGTTDPKFHGIEDFYSQAEWTAFLEQQAAQGPTDLVLAGDIIEFWQIATALGALPKRDHGSQPATGTMLAADQEFSARAVKLVIEAHPSVFRELGKLIGRGDHRVVIVAGNHDADLMWPKVQLAIARAIDPPDPTRLVFVDSASYQHAGVHVEHGHAFDAANRFADNQAPFGRDRDGRCRLQSSWGEVFVDQFYTDIERQVPFIDNLYPESAAILWAVRDNPDPQRDVGAAIQFLELIRVAQTRAFNKSAAKTVLQTVFGTPGKRDGGPESAREVVDHMTDRLVKGDRTAEAVANALFRLSTDPELAGLWQAILKAAVALPDARGAFEALTEIDPKALSHLRDRVFGDSMETAAKRIMTQHDPIRIVVFGHTHEVGGSLHELKFKDGPRYYANTGSWISVASVPELRAKNIGWDTLTLADRELFPSKTTAVIIEYDGSVPRKPVVWNR